MSTNVFRDLTYTSMEQFDGKKLKDNDLAAFRGRQFVRFHKHVQSLQQTKEIKDLLALFRPFVDKMTRWAQTTTEYDNEKPFPDSWRVHEPRFIKTQLTSYFGRLEDPPAQPKDNTAEAEVEPEKNLAHENPDAQRIDEVRSAIEGVVIGDNEEGIAVSGPGAFDDTEAAAQMLLGNFHTPFDAQHGPRTDTESVERYKVQPLKLMRRPRLRQPQAQAYPQSPPREPDADTLLPQQQIPAVLEQRPIVTPPPPPPRLPDEYYAFAHARSSRGHAEQRVERARAASKEASSAFQGADKSFTGEVADFNGTNRVLQVTEDLTRAHAEEQDALKALATAEQHVKTTKAAFRAWAREGWQRNSQRSQSDWF